MWAKERTAGNVLLGSTSRFPSLHKGHLLTRTAAHDVKVGMFRQTLNFNDKLASFVAELPISVDFAFAQVTDHIPMQTRLVDAARFR
jgi:hypothetical protein